MSAPRELHVQPDGEHQDRAAGHVLDLWIHAQKSHAVLSDPANQVEATEIISTPNFTGAMQDAITQYWNTSSMSADAFVEKVVTAMRSAS